MKYEINSKQAYHETMVTIYELMNKGEANLSIADLKKLAAMSAAALHYEEQNLYKCLTVLPRGSIPVCFPNDPHPRQPAGFMNYTFKGLHHLLRFLKNATAH